MTKAVVKNKGGAPTKYNEEVVKKLEEELAAGYSIRRACKNIGITRETYYNWLKIIPGLSDKMEDSINHPNELSRVLIVKKIRHGSDENARWWLPRRDPDFAPRPNTQVNILNQNMIKEVMEDESLNGWAV